MVALSRTRRIRRVLGWSALSAGVPLASLFAVIAYLTEPLSPASPAPAASIPAPGAASAPAAPTVADARSSHGPVTWPVRPLEGEPAKLVLLDYLRQAHDRLSQAPGYTATLRKQERIGGQLKPVHTIALKVRHEPFAVYMRFLDQEQGREVIFARGYHEDQMIAHAGGLARRLLPRLKLPPDSALAMADNRHPVTEAGLLNLVRKLIHFREKDLVDTTSTTLLERTTCPRGRSLGRAYHTHPSPSPDRPYARAEILFDLETGFPISFTGYDWPEPGTPASADPPPLGVSYNYEQVDLSAPLSDLDFDPANPLYEFRRY